jgi:type II secretory ATPase GspE/PulE/Tfp pilus assembly ATPase PilB-like protein
LDAVRAISKFKSIQVMAATKSAIVKCIEQNYISGKSLEDIIKRFESDAKISPPTSRAEVDTLANLTEHAPVVKFVNEMILDALKSRASDIHVEPYQDNVRVRFRIDGMLHTVISVPKELNLPIVPRIKILAQMDIAENRRPQDGRFTVNVAGRPVDLRVATFPLVYGESVSVRLLDKARIREIGELGLSQNTCMKFERSVTSSHGIILISGPTGSGKTTTLYAILKKIGSPEKNIHTIEDPIEYLMDYVNQSQVNPHAGLTFATALRSFLRHNPDVLMVGEIRDQETAEIAFRAALTGHLILSTLHTYDAPTAVSRLKDLGIDKNLLSSSMVCVLAQRLVRIVCSSCREEYYPEKTVLNDLKSPFDLNGKFYRGKGCEECKGTGYKGRIGIFELLEFTDEIKNLIMEDAPLKEIKKMAMKSGMKLLEDDGLEKVKQEITTVEEVMRVTRR